MGYFRLPIKKMSLLFIGTHVDFKKNVLNSTNVGDVETAGFASEAEGRG